MDVDQHVSCDQTLESCDVAKEEEERGAGLSAGGEEGEGEKSKMDKMVEVNPTYAKYLAEKRKESDELKQRTGKWVRRLKLVYTLTMHTSIHRKDNEKPCSVTSICISKDHRRLFIGDALGRIFSWTVSDNLGGVMQHWVLDHAVFNCYKCGVEFTFTERKYHCRDCGQIFCARCSNYETEVERLRIYKKVRVCANCYDTITLEKCKQIFRAPSDIDV